MSPVEPSNPPAPAVLSWGLSAAIRVLNALYRAAVDEFLARGISRGALTLVRPNGDVVLFGESPAVAEANGRPVALVTLHDEAAFYARVACAADIGFAEAFVALNFSVASPQQLTNIFLILILNRDEKRLSASSLLLSRVGTRLNGLLHLMNRNSISGSARNIEAHYDLSNDLFATFLGKSWTYSCAYFDPRLPDTAAIDLDAAQCAKLDRIIDKACITADCHVLEIGCGWGELAIRAVQRTGCRVTGITLSREQLHLARERAAAAGVADRVSFEVVDYRRLPERGVLYDRVVSIEMLEAVGHEYLGGYFGVLERVLKREGLAVLQVITTPEERYEEYRTTTDFIQKHIFPGGICPSVEAVIAAASKCSTLSLEQADNMGPHYATTLREWRRRFLDSVEAGRVASAGFDEFFVRKWVYYFCYCEAGFATRTLGVMQLVFSRPRNIATLGVSPVLAE